jgi:hypothetical protein
MIDMSLALLSLQQVLQAGILKHFKSAKFKDPDVDHVPKQISFETMLLGERFQIIIKPMGRVK